MKTTITAIAFLLMTSVWSQPADPCAKIADIQIGDLFNRYSKEAVQQIANEEAKKLGANKTSIELTIHQHPKLGKSYTRKATAWKCL